MSETSPARAAVEEGYSLMAVRTRLLPLFLVAILAAACTAGSSSSAETSLEPSASQEPEVSKPETASEPAEPTAKPCDPGFVCGSDLVPGEYTSTSTGATITFTLVGDGWTGLEDTPGDGFGLFHEAVGGPHGISVTTFSGEVFSDVCSPEATEMIGATADDFMRFLATVEGVQRGAPLNQQIGGQPTTGMDLTTESPCTDPDRMWLWTLPVHGDFHFNDAERVRVYAIDAGSATVVIVIEAFPDADYEVLLEKAEEVIATMTITSESG